MNDTISKENSKHYTWGNNCDGWVFVDTDRLSVKLERMAPDTSEAMHYHSFATQFFFILEGTANFSIDGEIRIVEAQQGIEIRPGQHHRISNHSETNLEFILSSQPSTKNDRIKC